MRSHGKRNPAALCVRVYIYKAARSRHSHLASFPGFIRIDTRAPPGLIRLREHQQTREMSFSARPRSWRRKGLSTTAAAARLFLLILSEVSKGDKRITRARRVSIASKARVGGGGVFASAPIRDLCFLSGARARQREFFLLCHRRYCP